MTDIEYLAGLARKVDKILKDELSKTGIKYDLAEARIYDAKRVGVQGDAKTYKYIAEITLFDDGKFVWNKEFIARLSSRITNELREDINSVMYVTEFK